MAALLYYSISSGLTKDEIIEIDRQVANNRKTVCIFGRNLASNAKGKTRKVIVVSILGGSLWFSNLQPSEAMGLSISPTPVIRVQPSYEHPFEVKIGPTVSPRLDKIRFVKPSELPVCIYMMDKRFLNTPEVSKLIKELRGGSLTTALISFVPDQYFRQV